MSTEYIKVLLIWDWKLAKYDILKYAILERISANCPIHLTFIPKLKHFPDILANKQALKLLDWKFKRNGLKRVFFIHEPQVWQVFRVLSAKLYPANRGFFLASLLACTKSFASLVFHVVVLFTFSYSNGKLTTRNTRDANDIVHAKRLARKKPLLAGYQSYYLNTIETRTKWLLFRSESITIQKEEGINKI